jgi:hypothetical protein
MKAYAKFKGITKIPYEIISISLPNGFIAIVLLLGVPLFETEAVPSQKRNAVNMCPVLKHGARFLVQLFP